MDPRKDRLAVLDKTRRQLRISKNKLTAVISLRERIALGAEVSACVSRLIELDDDVSGDNPAKAPPKTTRGSVPLLPKRGWWIR